MNYYSSFFLILIVFFYIILSNIDACDVMGSRACGERPHKDDQESNPVKYCIASRVYFECVHKKYRGCENKEKYEVAMESMMKGLRKRVDELLSFCTDKIEDYKFNIVWESPKKVQMIDSIRHGDSSFSSSIQSPSSSDFCQITTINNLCQSLMNNVKFNPLWNSVNKRFWCQQMSNYIRCLKSRLDQCPQQEIQNQFESREHFFHSQINIYCPGGVAGCTRQSTDSRCKVGFNQSNSSISKYQLYFLVIHSVLLQILLFRKD